MPSTSNTYDEFASQYAQWMTAQEKAGVEPGSNIAQFLQIVGDVSGLTVLDAGCGEGYLSRILLHRGAQVTGIDISPRLVEMARAKDPTDTITCKIRIGNKQGSGLKSGINEVSSTGTKYLWRQRGCSDTWTDQPFTP